MPPKGTIVSLLFAVFSVSLGYGALLPVLPATIARLSADPTLAAVIHHTGIVTAAYAGAAFLVSPISGRLADRGSTRWLIGAALGLGAVATVLAGFARNLPELYALRLVAGASAGAVTPAVQAWLGRWDATDTKWRTRRLVWVSIAATSGFFVGPLVGSLAASAAQNVVVSWTPREALIFVMIAAFQAVAALSVMTSLRRAPPGVALHVQDLPRRYTDILGPILQTSLISLAISAFEVALALPSNGGTPDPMEIGLLFALCSLVMILVQLFFAVTTVDDSQLRRSKLPAAFVLAAGLVGMAWAPGFALHFVSVALVASGGGAILLIMARELASVAGPATGTASGLTSSAGLAGQTGGAVLASLVVSLTGRPEFVFIVSAGVVLVSAFVALIVPSVPSRPPAERTEDKSFRL